MAYFAPYIDASGIHMPTYEDRLQDFLSAYRTYAGEDSPPEIHFRFFLRSCSH